MKNGLNEAAREFFRKQGARGGKLGLKGRMEKLTAAQRSAIAKNAVRIRELKRKQNGAGSTSAALAESSTVAETGAQKAKDLAIQRNYAARDGADQRNYERALKRQEKRLKKT